MTSLMIGSYWPSWKHQNIGHSTSKAPITRFEFSVATRMSNTSRHPKCSPKDMPGGRKLSRLTTLSLSTWKVARTWPMVCPDGLTTRSATKGLCSVSNGSSFGPGRFYRSAWQRPYPIKNRRFFKRTIALWLQILIREFSVWYIRCVAVYGACFGRLRFSISSNPSKR